jgi:TonB family protein
MRIRRLLGLKQNSAVSQAAAMAVLTVMITLAAAYLATVARAERKPAEVSTPAAAAVPDPASPVPPIAPNAVTAAARPALQTSAAAGPAEIAKVYQMWLDQDVLWIITPEERTAFLRLTTDAGRDRFIAQFWLRRNAPGMPADSYREEHYSRIAYANEHFRAADIPGWQSDRGHIVIAYGRPESIDSHPNGGDPAISPYPYEVWHYGAAQPNIPAQAAVKNIDFVFADECHCGNYRLIKQTGQPSASNRPSPSPIPAPAAAVATLCPPQVTGNQKIPTSSVLARLSSRQGDPFEPATVEKDFNTLWNTGYFSNVRMEREDTPKCVQLVIHLTEKPAAQLAVQPVSYRPAAAGPQPAAAAQPTGAITGLVVDQTGAVLPRAEVTATGSGTGVQTTFLTDNTGKFAFPALPPGRYTVAVDARGFRRLSQPNVEVAAGAQVGLNLKLLVGATSETLDVSAASTGPQAPAAPDAQSPDAGPMRVSSGTMAGNLISRPDPVYPPEAKAAHVQGTVVLHALISKTGAIQSLNVVSGPDMLRKSAIDAVSRWTYKPYLLNGEPREVDTVITVHFTFGGDASVPPPPPPPGAGAQAVAGPVRVSSGTIMGNLISRPDPIYPPEAKAAHIQGAVVLHALIAKSGQIEDLKLISGPKELAESAIDAVKQWVYKPYLLNGEPVEVDTTITVNFTFGGA